MDKLQNIARTYLSPELCQVARGLASGYRFRRQLKTAREGYQEHGSEYSTPILFVAGLPKSGTTWMKKMLMSYPGYTDVVIPEAVRYELREGGSHDFNLPEDTFERLDKALVVLKLHIHGSRHNAKLLNDSGIPYLIMYRDVRDVAVSYYYYVRQKPWHPEHQYYSDLSLEEGLVRFANTLLPEYVNWIKSWHENRDESQSIIIRYEDLLLNTKENFRKVAELFDIDSSPETVQSIVERHSFENMSGGRSRGDQNNQSFFRKGVSGDWVNHFTPHIRSLFLEKAGDALEKLGYSVEGKS